MTSKTGHKFTAGPWKAIASGIDAITVSTTLRSGRRVPFRVACCKDGDIEQVQANARLIAEAGTVAHETGLTPRQLAERCKELEAALRDMLREFDDHSITDDIKTQCGISANVIKALQRARAAIAKAEGGANA